MLISSALHCDHPVINTLLQGSRVSCQGFRTKGISSLSTISKFASNGEIQQKMIAKKTVNIYGVGQGSVRPS
jgi:hypothetical protein